MLIFITQGCINEEYVVTKDYIKSTIPFDYGFNISEIKVTEFKNEVPDKYDIIRTAILSFRYSTNDKRFAKTKKILFNCSNETYCWTLNTDYTKRYDILPIEFEKGRWYLIYHLMHRGSPYLSIYFNVKDNGELLVYQKYYPPR